MVKLNRLQNDKPESVNYLAGECRRWSLKTFTCDGAVVFLKFDGLFVHSKNSNSSRSTRTKYCLRLCTPVLH